MIALRRAWIGWLLAAGVALIGIGSLVGGRIDATPSRSAVFAAPDALVGLRTPTNRPAHLPAGPVLVEVFAPWCRYCATMARFEDASIAQTARRLGIPFVLVDVSRYGGVGQAARQPTLTSIETTAQDGSMVPLRSSAATAAVVSQFVERYHLTMPVFFDPAGVPRGWPVSAFPTLLLLNRQHHVVRAWTGWQAPGAVTAWVRQAAQAVSNPSGRKGAV